MGLQVWIPRSAQPIDTCRVPVGKGEVCGHKFWQGEERERDRHVLQCLRRHEAEIQEAREQAHPSIMKPWDPEQFEWIRRNGAAVLSGRLKV